MGKVKVFEGISLIKGFLLLLLNLGRLYWFFCIFSKLNNFFRSINISIQNVGNSNFFHSKICVDSVFKSPLKWKIRTVRTTVHPNSDASYFKIPNNISFGLNQ